MKRPNTRTMSKDEIVNILVNEQNHSSRNAEIIYKILKQLDWISRNEEEEWARRRKIHEAKIEGY